jgi:transcriptional regulator GlxA family with amidase domain
MMAWVENPEANVANRRLVAVLHDEISAASQSQLHLPVPRDPALKRLATRLAEDPEAAGDLAALAHEVGLSERSLFRNFQKETGLSPGTVAPADAGAALARTAGGRTVGDGDFF